LEWLFKGIHIYELVLSLFGKDFEDVMFATINIKVLKFFEHHDYDGICIE